MALLAICDRFKIPPSVARQEDMSILQLLRIEQLGVRREEVAEPDEFG